jgi:hypothetical protein
VKAAAIVERIDAMHGRTDVISGVALPTAQLAQTRGN